MKRIIVIAMAILFASSVTTTAADEIKFGVPAWPGVTVKTEIVGQLLETLGYEVVQEDINPSIIYKAMSIGEVDAFLGGWTPQQNPLIDPLKEKGEIEVVAANLDEAEISLCVPTYVWDAGVHSFADLDGHADKFDKTIYNIEAGTPMNTEMGNIIEKDIAGLGDWEQIGITTPVMMKQVGTLIEENKWVAFGCWKPHWMNILYDIKYLEGVEGTEGYVNKSIVYTVVRKGFSKDFPDVHRFLKQIYVTPEVQSQWIHAFGFEDIDEEKVARDWIAANLDTVGKWLEGVEGPDGKPAIDAVRAEFK
jgi:glycine betaine/proline transport system substrate-binding protein